MMAKATSVKSILLRLQADAQWRWALWSGVLLSGFWLFLLVSPIGPLDWFGLVDFRDRPPTWMGFAVKVLTELVILVFNLPGLIVSWGVLLVLSLLIEIGLFPKTLTENYVWIWFSTVFLVNAVFVARKHLDVLADR